MTASTRIPLCLRSREARPSRAALPAAVCRSFPRLAVELHAPAGRPFCEVPA